LWKTNMTVRYQIFLHYRLDQEEGSENSVLPNECHDRRLYDKATYWNEVSYLSQGYYGKLTFDWSAGVCWTKKSEK